MSFEAIYWESCSGSFNCQSLDARWNLKVFRTGTVWRKNWHTQQTHYLDRCHVVARHIADLSHSILRFEPVFVDPVNYCELITGPERQIIWQRTLVFVQRSVHRGHFVFLSYPVFDYNSLRPIYLPSIIFQSLSKEARCRCSWLPSWFADIRNCGFKSINNQFCCLCAYDKVLLL